ncbi:MAG TPA: chemotaxis protein CheC, partial [Paraburkholderia sp.]
MSEPILTEDQRDALQEVANLAMGQAATRLARL